MIWLCSKQASPTSRFTQTDGMYRVAMHCETNPWLGADAGAKLEHLTRRQEDQRGGHGPVPPSKMGHVAVWQEHTRCLLPNASVCYVKVLIAWCSSVENLPAFFRQQLKASIMHLEHEGHMWPLDHRFSPSSWPSLSWELVICNHRPLDGIWWIVDI